jgi:hypothetical protein
MPLRAQGFQRQRRSAPFVLIVDANNEHLAAVATEWAAIPGDAAFRTQKLSVALGNTWKPLTLRPDMFPCG